jgi:hypothetical protein
LALHIDTVSYCQSISRLPGAEQGAALQADGTQVYEISGLLGLQSKGDRLNSPAAMPSSGPLRANAQLSQQSLNKLLLGEEALPLISSQMSYIAPTSASEVFPSGRMFQGSEGQTSTPWTHGAVLAASVRRGGPRGALSSGLTLGA